jgi:TetR/AcrR family transcriptional regulator, repressor for uid operon
MKKKSSLEKALDDADAAPLTNRARQRIDTRNQVYEAAISEFKKSGITNTQIEAIVSRAGVSVGTFYRYFSSRDDVLRELQRRNAALIIERVERIKKSADLASHLKQLLTILLVDPPPADMVLERDALATLVKNPPEPDSIEVHPIYGSVIAKIQECQTMGLVRSDIAATTLGRIFFHQIFGVLAGTLREHRHPAELDALLSVYMQGLQNLPTVAARSKKVASSPKKKTSI